MRQEMPRAEQRVGPGVAPERSTRNPIGVCITTADAAITAIASPSSAKETSNACCHAINNGGRRDPSSHRPMLL